MLYQISVSDKLRPDQKKVIVRPHLAISEVAYWQNRMSSLLPDCRIAVQRVKRVKVAK